MCVCMYVRVCAHKCGGQTLDIHINPSPSYFLKESLSVNLEVYSFNLTGWPASPRDPPASIPPALGLWISLDAEDQDSVPRASTASTLPTEPSTQTRLLLCLSHPSLYVGKPVHCRIQLYEGHGKVENRSQMRKEHIGAEVKDSEFVCHTARSEGIPAMVKASLPQTSGTLHVFLMQNTLKMRRGFHPK